MLFRDERRPAGSIAQSLQKMIKRKGEQTPANMRNRRTDLSSAFANQKSDKERTSTEAEDINYRFDCPKM